MANAEEYEKVISALESGTNYDQLNSTQKGLADTLKKEHGERGNRYRRATGDSNAGSWGLLD